MNDKRIALLGGLLVVQLLVMVALLIARGDFSTPETGPLLRFDAAAIDGIVIDEAVKGDAGTDKGGEKSLALAKADGRWQLPDGIPADGEKIAKLLEKLGGLKAPWPVATTASARDRFEVGDDNRQRHVLLQSGGKSAAELLLGTSPGFRRLHVRVPGTDAIYEVDLTHFELSTKADDWVDRAVLAADGAVSAVAREGQWRLARSDEGWMLDDGAADSNAAEQMADRFANLRVLGVAPAAAEGSAETPAAVFAVTDGKGTYRLSLYGSGQPEGAEYVVVSDRLPGRFRLAAYLAEQLLADGATLLPGANPPAAAASGPAAAEAPAGAGAAPAPSTPDVPH